MAELTEALERQTEAPERTTIRELVERMKPELARVLPQGFTPERLARTYLTEIRRNPALLECSTESLLGALLLSAQVGLDPGPLGYVYLVPYKTECTWILGYTGIIELARRSGATGLYSDVVWDCDTFTAPWRNERGIHFEHRPGPLTERDEPQGVLVTWKESGAVNALFVPPGRVDRAKQASPAFRKGVGPWFTDTDAMWRKTGVRAARPFLPLSPQFQTAVIADESVVEGVAVETGEAAPILTSGDE